MIASDLNVELELTVAVLTRFVFAQLDELGNEPQADFMAPR
jgi:hypothetical protein